MSDSLITKKAIAEGLKEVCRSKSFEKITIIDITKACGLNRQTFYYHFQDKYELLSWIYYYEGFVKIIDGIKIENWSERLCELFEIMKKDKNFYMNTIKTSENYFKDYLFKISNTLFYEAIIIFNKEAKLKEDEMKFIAEFYSYGICGMVIEWVLDGMKEDTKSISSKLKKIAINSEKLGHYIYSGTVSE